MTSVETFAEEEEREEQMIDKCYYLMFYIVVSCHISDIALLVYVGGPVMKSTGKDPTSTVTRAAQLQLARKEMEKHKAVGADTIGERVKLSSGKAPLSKTSGSKGEKASAKEVDAIPMGLTSTTGGSSGSSVTVNFTLPSNFLDDDVVDHRKLFPHMGKYALPS